MREAREFYRRYLDGTAPAETVRQVQRAFIKEAQLGHPFYWAPFVLVGSN